LNYAIILILFVSFTILITNYDNVPSIRVRLVALWLWLNSFYYLFNAFVIVAILLILVSLETGAGGSTFVILKDNYPIILIPFGYTLVSFIYQHNAFKLLSLTKKSFYVACFLIMAHFALTLSTVFSMNYLLSSVSKQDLVPQSLSSITSFNFLLIIPIICIILLAFSYKEFENSEKKLSGKASFSIIIFSIIPIFLSIFLIIWGTTTTLDTDYNYASTQNATDYVIYKPEKPPLDMHYAVKYKTDNTDNSVQFILEPNKYDGRMIIVLQYSTIKKSSENIVSNLKQSCKDEKRICNPYDVSVFKSKTGKATYFESSNPKQFNIIYDTIDGTTVEAGFINVSLTDALDFLSFLK